MNLLELCEPLFQYVCILNRAGRKGGQLDYNSVYGRVKGLLDDMRGKAAMDPRLKPQYQKVEHALIFFVDSMVTDSGLTFARRWNDDRLAYSFNELAGDEKFFDLLDETTKEPGEEAAERLAIYYTCIGLGFTGWYAGQPEYLRKKMLEIAPRLRHLIEVDSTLRVCPEAYENVDARNLVEPPSSKMVVIAIIFVVFMLTTLACNFVMFRKASDQLTDSLQKIIVHEADLKK